jgi:hypothetical protein
MTAKLRSFYFCTVFFALIAIFGQAVAENAFISENGQASINGQVTSVSFDEFVINYGGNDIVVTMRDANDDTIETLIESDIIDDGVYASVNGEMTEEYGDLTIHASSINVYTP